MDLDVQEMMEYIFSELCYPTTHCSEEHFGKSVLAVDTAKQKHWHSHYYTFFFLSSDDIPDST